MELFALKKQFCFQAVLLRIECSEIFFLNSILGVSFLVRPRANTRFRSGTQNCERTVITDSNRRRRLDSASIYPPQLANLANFTLWSALRKMWRFRRSVVDVTGFEPATSSLRMM